MINILQARVFIPVASYGTQSSMPFTKDGQKDGFIRSILLFSCDLDSRWKCGSWYWKWYTFSGATLTFQGKVHLWSDIINKIEALTNEPASQYSSSLELLLSSPASEVLPTTSPLWFIE